MVQKGNNYLNKNSISVTNQHIKQLKTLEDGKVVWKNVPESMILDVTALAKHHTEDMHC